MRTASPGRDAARGEDQKSGSRFSTASAPALQAGLRYQRAITRVHALGPRPVGEFINEMIVGHDIDRDAVIERLERYAQLDPAVVRAVGGREYPRPPLRRIA